MKRICCGFLAAALAAGIMLTPASAAEYQDIESHWGKSAIQQVTDWGLFNGVGDSVFAPDAEMTRGMFVTVLVRTAQHLETYKEPAQQASFADVTQTDYFANGVAWAQENGMITGVDAERFAPNDQITREQMCVIMARYLANFTGCDLSVNQKNETTFLDQTSIQDYAAQSVDVCLALGLVTGVPTSDGMEFQPAQPASRAAVAVMLERMVRVAQQFPVQPEEPAYGGGGGGSAEVQPGHTEEEIAEEAEMAGYLESMLENYRNSTYLHTTDQEVQDTMALLMDCIEDALEQRSEGKFLNRSFIRKEYSQQISQLRKDYKALSEEQLNQINNVILRLGDTEEIYFVMDYFGVEMA